LLFRRQETQGKNGKNGRHDVTVHHVSQPGQNLARYPVDHGHIGIIPWQAGARYPYRGTYKQHVPVKQYVVPPPRLILNKPPHGTRPSYVHHKHPPVRQVMPNGSPRVPFSPYHMQGNVTVPFIRLGTYRPKVIQGTIAPQNIRDHEQPIIVNTTFPSTASSEMEFVPPQYLYEKCKYLRL